MSALHLFAARFCIAMNAVLPADNGRFLFIRICMQKPENVTIWQLL